MIEVLAGEPLARPVYVSAADPDTLAELRGPVSRALLSMAVFVGRTALIDNIVLGEI
jgi:pantoate--beta-alanine ligase